MQGISEDSSSGKSVDLPTVLKTVLPSRGKLLGGNKLCHDAGKKGLTQRNYRLKSIKADFWNCSRSPGEIEYISILFWVLHPAYGSTSSIMHIIGWEINNPTTLHCEAPKFFGCCGNFLSKACMCLKPKGNRRVTSRNIGQMDSSHQTEVSDNNSESRSDELPVRPG